jgi:hypothetical protein
VGHEKLVNKVKAEAKGGPAFVYLSHTQKAPKDPLSYDDKIKYAQAAFGRIVKKSSARTIIEVMKELQGKYSAIKLVVGSDRVSEFKTLLNKYNGKDYNFDKIQVVSAGERDPDSEGVSGMSASKMRQAVKDNMFASFRLGLPQKLKKKDLEIFKKVRDGMGISEGTQSPSVEPKGIPLNFDITEADIDYEKLAKMFDKGEIDDEDLEDLGIDMVRFIKQMDDDDEDQKEEVEEDRAPMTIAQRRKAALRMRRLAPRMARFRKIRKKRMATPERLKFRARKQAIMFLRKRAAGKMGEKYRTLSPSQKIGIDKIIMKKRPMVAKIAQRLMPKVRKSEMERLKKARQGKVNESFELFIERAAQDPDINKRAGTQPAKYHRGLSPATKAKRDAQFKKQARMSDDNPAAYKPAPGDASAKTKPSEYTKAYKQMYGEAASPEITVGSYTTTHFHMCGSAIKAMKKHASKDGAQELTKMQDDFYKMEKEVMNRGAAKDTEKAKAQTLYDRIMSKAKDMGIEKDVGGYMKMHLNSIIKGNPKPGFGIVNESENVNRVKADHKREKEVLARQHDQEKDRARLQDVRAKNRATEEAKRGRPKKGTGDEEGIEHIQIQLRKVINLRGMKPVEFTDGKKTKVSPQTARKVLDIIDKTRDSSKKQQIVKYISKSLDNLNSVASGKKVQKADPLTIPLKSLGAQTDYVGTARVSGISGQYARGMAKVENALQGKDRNDLFEKFLDEKKNIKSYANYTSSIAPRDNYILEKDMSGLRKKAEKSGISYGTLKKVYDRGVAAWRTGHRPGTTPSQWGYARVNAFITKKKKGGLNHDQDLAHYDPQGDMISEAKDPSMVNVLKVMGPTKNAKEGIAAIKRVFKVNDKKAEELLDRAIKHALGEELNEISTDVLNRYYKMSKQSRDKAVNSAIATILRKGDHSKDLDTRRKREKGMKMAKSRAVARIRGESHGIGTDELTKAYTDDTPGQSFADLVAQRENVNEEFEDFLETVMIDDLNESFTAGIPDAPFAHELGIKAIGGFAHHPSVEEDMIKDEPCCDDCADHFDHVISEAEYQGKKVKLNDPIRGGNKKFYVYTKNEKGNVVKVSFGDTTGLSIKRDDPERRKSFRARHNCDNPGPKWKARYWSCYQWRAGAKVDN